MYPEYLHALARQHELELQRHQKFRKRTDAAGPSRPPPLRRARRSLGTVLVMAGTRLLEGAVGGVELSDWRR